MGHVEHAPPTSKGQAQVIATVKKLKKKLRLDDWTIRIVFAEPDNAYATCGAQPEYRVATITIDIDHIPTHDSVEAVILHEMVHIVLASEQQALFRVLRKLGSADQAAITDFAEAEVERATTDVTSLLAAWIGIP